ncbi:hypothetical protein MCOR13_003995 [Pyricularia oryzae]|nr:hypothetical protein MCOR13_003995 [Pyricularia oryzae]
MQRRRRPDLNINVVPAPNIAIVEQCRDDADAVPAPPQTPPNQKPSLKSSLKAAPPSNRGHKQPPPVSLGSKHTGGAFLEDKTPTSLEDMYNTSAGDNGGGRSNSRTRDSHDLSIPARTTRDSLVTNMLLSLDQMSMGQMTSTRQTYEDLYNSPTLTEAAARPMFFSTTKPAGPNPSTSQGHSYSYSSDLDGTDTESKALSHAGYHRYHRSNSSSNFQMSLGRINSMREISQKSLPATPPRHGPAHHSRNRKGSKGSSSNSLDAGYPPNISTYRRTSNAINGPIRSSSYDLPTKQTRNDGGRVAGGQGAWQMDFDNANLYNGADGRRSNFVANAEEEDDDYEVAPTPNIPGGPRRLNTVPSLPNFPASSSHSQSFVRPKSPAIPPVADPERKRSTRSTRSATVGARARAKSSASSRDLPPLPAGGAAGLDADSAPAPHVGYEKSKGQPVHAGAKGPSATTSSSQQPKEKVGFFRRVFGGRKDAAPPTDSPTPKTATSPHSRRGSADQKSQMKLRSTPPSRDSEHSGNNAPVQTSYGTLQKKTSSFFRRHKKQQEEAPPLPVNIPHTTTGLPSTSNDTASNLLPPRLASPPKPEYSPGLTRALEPYLISSAGPSPSRDVAGSGTSAPISQSSNNEIDDNRPESRTAIEVDREVLLDSNFSTSDEQLAASSDGIIESQTPRRRDYVSAGNADTPQRQTPSQSNHMIRAGSFLSDSDSDSSPQRPSRASEKTLRPKMTDPKKLVLPIEGPALEPPSAGPKVSTASLPSVKIDKAEPEKQRIKKSSKSPTSTSTMTTPTTTPIDEPEFVVGQPTPDDIQKAQKIFDGNEDFITKEKAAAWMGEEGPIRQRTLHVYMSLFDFSSRSIVASLRDVCNRLILRGETQQVDRILAAFATRWCDCNPDHGFKAIDVVHTICYSIMLLNTDLHMADIESKMTRSQFVKNTMGTIRQSLADAAPDAFGRQSILPGKNSSLSPEDSRTSVDQDKPNFRNSFLGSISVTGREASNEADDCGPLVKAPFEGTLRAWEAQVEIVLKDTYQSIRDQRLPLFGAGPQLNSQSSLSVIGMLKRSPSVLSKAPSEGHISTRGRINETSRPPATTSRWTSKSRSRARAQLGATGFSSSRTSFEDSNSLWSPSVSSATRSRYSLGRTQTSMSIESVGSSYAGSKFQQSIGFANALSQAIIREDVIGGAGAASLLSMDNNGDEAGSNVGDGERPLLEDESLELAGPPWVKEGRVIHKHHLDGIDKKAKERNWSEVFAVVQKGTLSMFSFTPNKSMGKKSRGRSHRHDLATMGVGGGGLKSPPVVVGGGNWQDNATNLGTFSLKQTLASALPPPGYSSSRPHVWALSLPTGAVHLFQVGTPEISKEFVTTVNYWSARLSTHPLVGGISNIEYGWSEAIINNPLVTAITEATGGAASIARPGSAAATTHQGHQSRVSLHSRSGSFRSGSLDFGRSRSASLQSMGVMDRSDAMSERGSARVPYAAMHSGRGKLPGDKIHIADWRPPAQSLRASSQSEEGQLATLTAYVASIEEELRQHNALRSPMLLAFSPRSSNASKAMGNWQRKSEYLLRESVKYRTYVDALHEAAQRKEEVYGQRKDE